jgi:hypothetical protein
MMECAACWSVPHGGRYEIVAAGQSDEVLGGSGALVDLLGRPADRACNTCLMKGIKANWRASQPAMRLHGYNG